MARTRSKAKKRKDKRRRLLLRLIYRPLRWLAYALAAAILLVGSCTVIDPPGGYYLATEWVRLGHIEREWRDLEDISPDLARAVMAAEDANFCDHWGFDLKAIEHNSCMSEPWKAHPRKPPTPGERSPACTARYSPMLRNAALLNPPPESARTRPWAIDTNYRR